MFMMQKGNEINPFNSDWFIWVDAGICNYRTNPPPIKKFPNNNIFFLEQKTMQLIRSIIKCSSFL